MKKTFFLFFALCYAGILFSQTPVEIPVWPDGPAESNGLTGEEIRTERSINNITSASFTVFPADKQKNKGAAVLICPGGGYSGQAFVHEGVQFAEWLASNGITGIVLKYRLPNGHHEIPLKDTQQAMRIIRQKASEWEIDPAKIGVMGFSAGGHLASTLLTKFDDASRPDFGILFYPVISMQPGYTHQGSKDNLLGKNATKELYDLYSNEKQIQKDTPPTLIFHSDDDTAVVPQNSIQFYEGLKARDIPASMYIFPTGGHGWGFRDTFAYHEPMKELMLKWLSNQKFH